MSPPANAPSGRRALPGVVRWLHIYVSMAGFAATLFFSVTGLTLNHPDWLFGTARRETAIEGTFASAWVGVELASDRVARLEVVEALRSTHGIRGALDDFRIDPAELSVAFKGPGYAADVFVDRRTGRYEGTIASEGLIAVMNDLHKGRHTGGVWAWIIDLSAILLAVVSLSGLLLMLYLRRRRRSGLIVGALGLAVCIAIAWWWVG